MQASFPTMEEEVLSYWEANDIFRKSVPDVGRMGNYVFYDGPPFATGTPHYGHILASTIKDVIPRYWTMRGYKVERRFGWDTHGLPIEAEMQNKLGLNGPGDIQEYGVVNFNEACRENVLRYTEEWRKTLTRLGRWVDFDNDYKTMDLSFMETVWWVFKQLWDKGLVYSGTQIMPYSWKLSTPLSNFEANNYQEHEDPAVTVRVKTAGGYLLVWTTTPWTLPANLAIAVNPKIDYARVQYEGEVYFTAFERVEEVFKDKPYHVIDVVCGSDLVGLAYEPIFEFFKDHENSFRVLSADYVSTEQGTGLVHLAPAYGEDDYYVCSNAGIDPVDPVDAEGKFTEQAPLFIGEQVHEANAHIIRRLKVREQLFSEEKYTHQYPFCWRTDTPLIYKAVPVWFVAMEQLKDKLIAANNKVNWVPDYVGSRRFNHWLENTRDWAVSRNRFWGTPIPIYECSCCSHQECLGSVADLEARAGRELADIHPHVIDDITYGCPKCSANNSMFRTKEVFDCWFESGSMPLAQNHYPFESELNDIYPASFIAEGLDQTRGWFYTLLAIAVALDLEPPYKNVVVNGILRGPDGKKLSKRLKNYTDPMEMMNKYGADALRAYLLTSPAVHAQDLLFKDEGVKSIVKNTIIPLRSALSFFVQYANADEYNPVESSFSGWTEMSNLDKWILSRLAALVAETNKNMESYQLDKVLPSIDLFIDELNNWYIRKSRKRFWKSEGSKDKRDAYNTLHLVLSTLSQLLAPVMPYMAEYMFQTLNACVFEAAGDEVGSVHHSSFPQLPVLRDHKLEYRMQVVREISHMGHALREKNRLKVRQPLRKCIVVTSDSDIRNAVLEEHELICDELNVKTVEVHEDDQQLCTLKFLPNYKTLGPRFGKRVKEVVSLISEMSGGNYKWLQKEGALVVANDSITPEDIVVNRVPNEGVVVESNNDLIVAFDTQLDLDLKAEGQAREFISVMQKERKKNELDITDRIEVELQGPLPSVLQRAFEHHLDHMKKELLADSLTVCNTLTNTSSVDVNEETISFLLRKSSGVEQ